MTRDVITQLGLLLGAALAARFIAGLLKVPEMLVLVAVGLLLSGVIDVPLDSTGAQLLFTLGVSMILFYGGLNLSLPVLRRVWVSLSLLVVPGVVLTAVVTGLAAYLVFDLSWTAALLLGAVLAPTDPAILIPLFIGSRLRKKVSQTVVAESAFNDPTGAALALALAGVLLSGETGVMEPAAEFIVDLAISSVLGIAAGVLLALTISSRRIGIWDESAGLAVLAVVAESAFNDPVGAALALALAGVLVSGDSGLMEPAADFIVDLAISSVLGIAAGVLLALTISSRRIGIWDESAGLAVLAVVAIAYVSLDSAGGSGYLGAFLAGLIVGNMEHLRLGMHSEHEDDMRRFAANLSDLATLFVFVVLGANIPLDDLADHLLPALAVLAMLLLVARPLTVLACVLPDRGGGWTWRELAFLCWTRETGVVPAALVGVIVGLGVPNGDIYASVVALAIVVTLLLQALPAPWLAWRLGLLDEPQPQLTFRTAAGTDPLPTE